MKTLSAWPVLLFSALAHAKRVPDLFRPLKPVLANPSKAETTAVLESRSLVERQYYCDAGEEICDTMFCIPSGDLCCGIGLGIFCYADSQECCNEGCAGINDDCCETWGRCEDGLVCTFVDGIEGCCPPSGCYSDDYDFDFDYDYDDDTDTEVDVEVSVYTQVIYWYIYVYWYIEIWYYIEINVQTSTLELTSSSSRTSSTASVTASNSLAASASFESISESVTESASTTPDLDDIPTSTTTTDSTASPTSTPTDSDFPESTLPPIPTDFGGSDDSGDSGFFIDGASRGYSGGLWYTPFFTAILGLLLPF